VVRRIAQQQGFHSAALDELVALVDERLVRNRATSAPPTQSTPQKTVAKAPR
jgi:hypothetical protein